MGVFKEEQVTGASLLKISLQMPREVSELPTQIVGITLFQSQLKDISAQLLIQGGEGIRNMKSSLDT